MKTASRFARLIDLAKAPSSEKRRELLREVTDMFFVGSAPKGEAELALFDEVLLLVAAEMQDQVLEELSARFADAPDAPVGLMRDLANRSFAIAEPIVSRCSALNEGDLLAIVNVHGQDHIRAVAGRPDVSAPLSDAIVSKGDDAALDTLLRNVKAKFTRHGMETAVDRARSNAALHEGVVNRRDVPLDLMNEMCLVVAQSLRARILQRNAGVDPATLDEALAQARKRLGANALPADPAFAEAQRDIAQQMRRGALEARLLVSYYREHKLNHFFIGLAELTSIDVATAQSIIRRGDMDALAMICRAASIERPLFVTIAVLACGGDRAMGRAEEFGALYNAVPLEAAQRAMRFYKVRKTSQPGASEAA